MAEGAADGLFKAAGAVTGASRKGLASSFSPRSQRQLR